MGKMSLGVVIPTFKRVEYLGRCIDSILPQLEPSDELVVICRIDDMESIYSVKQRQRSDSKVKLSIVSEVGHLPPLIQGIRSSSTDIVAFVDDDAIVCNEWVQTLKGCYNADTVGGAGGVVIQYYNGEKKKPYTSKTRGKLTWYGKAIGNMDSMMSQVQQMVHFLPGGNMSYRREALDKVVIDLTLNRGAAICYELDLGLQVIKLGYKIAFCRDAYIHHYNAPRQIDEKRDDSLTYMKLYSANYSYILMKNLNAWRKAAFIAYFIVLGQKVSPGFVTGLYMLITRKTTWQHIITSFSGKIIGFRLAQNFKRNGTFEKSSGSLSIE